VKEILHEQLRSWIRLEAFSDKRALCKRASTSLRSGTNADSSSEFGFGVYSKWR